MISTIIILAAALAAAPLTDEGVAHQGRLGIACAECHMSLPLSGSKLRLRDEINGVCVVCHPRHHGTETERSHPVDVLPTMHVPPDMPLDRRGMIGCITCHAFHEAYRDTAGDKRFYLRRAPGKRFCFSCHQSLPGLTGSAGNPAPYRAGRW